MQTKTIIIIAAIVIFGGLGFYFSLKQALEETSAPPPLSSEDYSLFDPQNAVYLIDGQEVFLIDGRAEETSADSATMIITSYFGNEVTGDFNGNGLNDAAFLLTRDTGGSGTFYYVAAALNGGDRTIGTNAVLLGDRIAPQTTEFRNNEIVVNFAERAPGEPFTAPPSIGVSKSFRIENNTLAPVE